MEFQKGQRVRYIPQHAHGDPTHPDCETGVVKSVLGNTVFVIYDNLHGMMTTGDEDFTAQGTNAHDLQRIAPLCACHRLPDYHEASESCTFVQASSPVIVVNQQGTLALPIPHRT